MGGRPSRVVIKYEDAERRLARKETKQLHEAFLNATQFEHSSSGENFSGSIERFMNSKQFRVYVLANMPLIVSCIFTFFGMHQYLTQTYVLLSGV